MEQGVAQVARSYYNHYDSSHHLQIHKYMQQIIFTEYT